MTVGEDAVAHLEDLGVCVAAIGGDGDGVERADRALGDALALHQRAHGAQAVALERGLLVVLGGGGRAHALLEIALDRAEAPGEEVDHAVDAAPVVLLGDVADTGGFTALDVVVQAWAAAAAARLGARAGAVHEHLGEHLKRRAHALGVGVGAEVGAARAVALAREVDPRVVLVERDGDERVGLVVAQADVEARAVLLDEALLGQQRLGLAGDDDALDRFDARPPSPRGPGWRSHLGLGEVRGDALADRLGLADVDDAALGVAEQVDAWLVGQRALLGQTARRCSAPSVHEPCAFVGRGYSIGA